jgi:hypothetical protein
MKKVKIMLLSLALFAVVGGTVAFKVKFTSKYCVTWPIKNAQGQPTCNFIEPQVCVLQESITTTGSPGLRLCTAMTNGNAANPCDGVTTCANLGKIIND